MKSTLVKIFVYLSVALNVFVALPLVSLTIASTRVTDATYSVLSERFGGHAEIVFIGDSLTLGGGLWGQRLGRYDFSVRNFGVSGFTPKQMSGATAEAIKLKPKHVFVMAGINFDDKTVYGAEVAFQDYRKAILDPLVSAGFKPVIEFTLYRENDPEPDFVDALNSKLAAYAKERGLDVIDMTNDLSPNKSLSPAYSKDGLHLTKAAYLVWQEKINQYLSTKT